MQDPPSFYLCSITHEIMKDPYIDRHDGISYEKDAIMQWLAIHSTSPHGRHFLTPADLTPNRALKESIELFLNDQYAAESKPISVPTQINATAVNNETHVTINSEPRMSLLKQIRTCL